MNYLSNPKEGQLASKAEGRLRPPLPPPTTSPPTPAHAPSVNSSSSNEFSFTISLHTPNSLSSNHSNRFNLGKHTPPPFDFDLAPADDIFFNGHLLPLHFLSQRPSDSSTGNDGLLPLELVETEKKQSTNTAAAVPSDISDGNDCCGDRSRSKPLSLFFGLRKWLDKDRQDEERQRRRRKMVFDVMRLWKKYASLVEPLLLFKGCRSKQEFRRSPYSCNSFSREGGWQRRCRGEHSAPASIRTSPANSGLLVAPATSTSTSDDSTMEELQNAIQAAIAHCKDSKAVNDDK